jgi:hypothetical protein
MAVAAPLRRPRRALLLSTLAAAVAGCGIGYVVHVWPAPEPFIVPHDDVPVPALLVMNGRPDAVGPEGHQCLALLDEWVRHPNWEVTIRRGVTGCTGEWVQATLTVDASGDAVLLGDNLPPRPLHLTPPELQRLHTAAFLSCDPDPAPSSYASDWIDLQWGGDASEMGRRVSPSPVYHQLAGFLDDAVAAYSARRLAERRDFGATVVVPADVASVRLRKAVSVTVTGAGEVDVYAGRRRITTTGRLDASDLVAAIDWIELDNADPMHIPDGLARLLADLADEHGLLR